MNRQTSLATVSKLVVELTGALAAREHQLAAAEANLTSLRATLSEREKELARFRSALEKISAMRPAACFATSVEMCAVADAALSPSQESSEETQT